MKETTVRAHSRKTKNGRTNVKRHNRKLTHVYKADNKGIILRPRETKILKNQVDSKEHAGGFDYDVKSKPKRFYSERGKNSSVKSPVHGNDDFEIEFHTHPIEYKKTELRYKTRLELSKMPSDNDIKYIIENAINGIRNRSLLITPDKQILEIRVVDIDKAKMNKDNIKSMYEKNINIARKKYPDAVNAGKKDMTPEQQEATLKFIRYLRRKVRKDLLDFGVVIINHKSRQTIKLDMPIRHSRKRDVYGSNTQGDEIIN